MSDFQERLSQLSPEKRALLEKMLLEQAAAQDNPQSCDGAVVSDSQASASAKILRRPEGSEVVLSQAEKRLWFVDRLEPNHPFYNMPLAARLQGELDRDAFATAIQTIAMRHETLRSTYHLRDGEPVKTIHDEMAIAPIFEAIHDEELLQQRLREESRKPFDVEAGPLLRVIVFSRSNAEHVVLLVMHHIVSDGWSMIVMLREIAQVYDAVIDGQASGSNVDLQNVLPPLAVQYSDFAHWQNEHLTEEVVDAEMEYWRDQLLGAPEVLDLPTDFPRPAVQDFEGATHGIELSVETTAKLNTLANELGATPFMLLIAAESILLARCSRQNEFVLGTAAANRSQPELEDLIGFFVGTLPLRVNAQPNLSFRQLVAQIRETILGAFDHAHVPFEKLVEEFASSRDRSYSPIFQAALVMQNVPRDLASAEGTSIQPLHIDNGTAKYDLTFFLWEESQQLVGHIEYRTRLFKPETVARIAECFEVLLSDALTRPDTRIDELSLISDTHRREVIEDFNRTHVPLDEPHLLHQTVEQHALRAPSQIAMVDGGKQFTYAELSAQSDRVAAALCEMKIDRETAVVTLLPRGITLTSMAMGIMKAGGTYVPLDPATPEARVRQILEQTKAPIVVGSAASRSFAEPSSSLEVNGSEPSALANVTFINAETLCETKITNSQASGLPNVAPSDRAYIVFTSGSTGEPKGVEVEHHSIVNFVRAQAATMGVASEDRILHSFSPSFDGSLSEVFLALSSGATLVVAPPETVQDPRLLTSLMQREDVTLAKFPPALLSMLDPADLPKLKTLASAGDKLTGELARRWLGGGRRFFNGYGPTEVSVGVSMMELDNEASGKPPIGGPMQNMTMYVLDRKRQPLPVGMPGEIYIGGAGVARGYLNQQALTDAVFVADPFADRDAARMYRTGDLGRWLPSGVVEFLGRADDQISLRGFRVEPGEIAAAIERIADVRQAAVVLRENAGSGQLIAYVVREVSGNGVSGDREIESEHVSGWNNLFESAHKTAPPVLDPQFNITGWISTFTGDPIPPSEMRQWADRTAARIERLNPRRVLEIGCGTGLILLRLAEACDTYVGTDLLEPSLENVRQALKQRPELEGKVTLHHQPADRLGELKGNLFDTIILNSVIQYFPSVDYLAHVIGQAANCLDEGGRIFIGDVRSHTLHAALAAAVEIGQADREASIDRIRSRVKSRIVHEEELLVAPAFFASLSQVLPRLGNVEIQIKDADNDNELNRFRYDVTLHFDHKRETADVTEIAFGAECSSAEGFAKRLSSSEGKAFVLRGIPNKRVAGAVRAAEMLGFGEASALANGTVSFDELLRAVNACEGFDPNEFPSVPIPKGFTIRAAWNAEAADKFDVFVEEDSWRAMSPSAEDVSVSGVDRLDLANNPLASRREQQLSKRLRAALRETLPQYMIPSAFVLLDQIPRTQNGKIDQAALPQPVGRPEWVGGYEAPVDTFDQLIVEVWEDLLDVRPIGITDNFFELGGHSMVAVRMMSEIERRSGHTIPLAALFQEPTVAHLSGMLRDPSELNIASSLVPLRPNDSGVPLFCVHPAGGTVFCYRELAACLKSERPVFGIQALGVDGKQLPHDSLNEMAEHYCQAIQKACPDGKLHIAGWSLGGNIAFEVARQLRESGRAVGVVALLDAGLLTPDKSLSEEDFLPLIMALFPGAEEHLSLETLREKSPEEQLNFFIERAAQAGIVMQPPEVSSDEGPHDSKPSDARDLAGAHVFQVFQSNVKAVHQHEASVIDGGITLFRPSEQSKTNTLFDDPYLGWKPFASSVEVVNVPGNHAHMLQKPAVERLALELDRLMKDAD